MEILDTFLANPTSFVLGFGLMVVLYIFKYIRILYKQHSGINTNLVVNGHTPNALFSKEEFMEQVGIKEVKEAIIAIDAISYVAYSSFKGEGTLQEKLIKFASNVVADKELHQKVIIGAEGYEKLVEEAKDLSVQEGFELGGLMLGILPKYFIKK